MNDFQSKFDPTLTGQQLADLAYSEIIRTSNKFLFLGKRFSIYFLATENPTLQDLSDLMQDILGYLETVKHSFGDALYTDATDYCRLMSEMAIAVSQEDDINLQRLVVELGSKTGVVK